MDDDEKGRACGRPVDAVAALSTADATAGLDIPDDVSVVGFDDLPEAPYFAPSPPTVRQDFAELDRRGVQLLLAGPGGEERHLDPVPATLVVRSSTGQATRKGRAGHCTNVYGQRSDAVR